MTTRIYVSNKIQKGYKKLVLNALPNKSEMLENQNSWNANYVAIFGRKCWLLTHTLTRYTVIVPDVKVKDTDRFLSILIESIIGQLKIKNIINPDKVYEFIEEVEFYPTNNDRSTIAYNNQRMQDVNYWKFEFDSFEEFSFSMIGSNINEIGMRPTNGISEYIQPSVAFLSLINSCL